MTFRIPATKEEALAEITAQSAIASASGWKLAALLYVYVQEPGTGGDRKSREFRENQMSNLTFDPWTVLEFAEFKIRGLMSHNTISTHRKNWIKAIERGVAKHIGPDDEIDFPDEDYPPTGHCRGLRDAFTSTTPVEEKAEALRTILKQEPELAQRIENDFVEKASKDTTLAYRVQLRYEEEHPVPLPKPQPKGGLDLMVWYGFGTYIYEMVHKKQDELRDITDFIKERGDELEPNHVEALRGVISDLAKTRELLIQYENELEAAMGIDVNETFRRLVRE
jgi:hypothetical protein